MTLTQEEVKELKAQLKEQIKHLPPDKRRDAEKQIDEMSSQAIEAMLEQQKGRQQVFRMIANKEIDSVVIEENSNALAVLEINPLSEGHTLIIPKNEVRKKNEIPKEVLSFAEKVVKKIEGSLKPKKINMVVGEKMGETIIDLIPIYNKEINDKSERKQVKKEDLEFIKKKINVEIIKKPEPEKIKIEKPKIKEIIKLKRKIP